MILLATCISYSGLLIFVKVTCEKINACNIIAIVAVQRSDPCTPDFFCCRICCGLLYCKCDNYMNSYVYSYSSYIVCI